MEEKTTSPQPTPNSFVHLYSWVAPNRQWSKKDTSWFLRRAIVFMVLIFLAAVTRQVVLIVALIALLLLIFAQASVPPRIAKHEITNIGIRSFDRLFRWRDIDSFWVSVKKIDNTWFDRWASKSEPLEVKQFNFEMPGSNPAKLSLLIGNGNEDEIIDTLVNYIPYATKEQAQTDILARWIYGDLVPLSHYFGPMETFPETDDYPELVVPVESNKNNNSATKTDNKVKKAKPKTK